MPVKIEFTTEQINKIIEMYKSGNTIKKIAPFFKVSDATIARTLRRNDVEKNRYNLRKFFNPKISDEQEKEIISLYTQGLSCSEISKKFDVTNSIIYRRLKINNVTLRKPGELKGKRKLTEEQDISICNLFRKGASYNQLSEKFGVVVGTIKRILRRNDIDLKKHKKQKVLNFLKQNNLISYEKL